MASSVVVILDTTPPVITVRQQEITPERELIVEYSLDEEALLGATLNIPGYDPIPMTIDVDTLSAQLPDGTPYGMATIDAPVQDEVLNEAVRRIEVSLSRAVSVAAAFAKDSVRTLAQGRNARKTLTRIRDAAKTTATAEDSPRND